MLKVLLVMKFCVCHLRLLAGSCSWQAGSCNLSELHLRCRSRYDEWLILCGFDRTMNFCTLKG